MRESTILHVPSQAVEPEDPILSPDRAGSDKQDVSRSTGGEIGPDFRPRFRSLLARLANALSKWLADTAVFEVRNIRTGEISQTLGLFPDATMADRAARGLGRDWEVFRREDPATGSLIALSKAVERG